MTTGGPLDSIQECRPKWIKRLTLEGGRPLKRLLPDLAALAIAIFVGFAASWLWGSYQKPKISIHVANGFKEWSQEIRGDSAYITTILTDAFTGEVAFRVRGVGPSTLVAPFAGNREGIVKFVVQNSGRSAATNLRIPIYVNRPARTWLDFSSRVGAQLLNASDPQLPLRIEAIHVASLPPQASAVLTYHFEIDDAIWSGILSQPLLWRVLPPTADEVSQQSISLTEIPFGIAAIQEKEIGVIGMPVFTPRFRPSGAGGLLVVCVDSADIWYSKIITLCGGRGPGDARPVALIAPDTGVPKSLVSSHEQ